MNSSTISRLTAQAECYKILVLLFCEPLAGVHDKRELYNNLVKSTGLLKPKELELARKLRNTVKGIKIQDLFSEYIRLFNHSDSAAASPLCESYQSSPDEAANTANWLSEFYHNSGFHFDPTTFHPCHIVTELKFIQFLIEMITTEFRRDNFALVTHYGNLRCRFVHEHMLKWIPEFTRRILFNSKSPYYLQLAILLRTILVSCSEEDE